MVVNIILLKKGPNRSIGQVVLILSPNFMLCHDFRHYL